MAKLNKNTKVILDVVYGKHKNSTIFWVQNHVKPEQTIQSMLSAPKC